MTSFYPRTEILIFNAAELYKNAVSEYYAKENSTYTSASSGFEWARISVSKMASKISDSLERLSKIPPVLPKQSAKCVYEWLAKFPDFCAPHARERIAAAFEKKISKKLL